MKSHTTAQLNEIKLRIKKGEKVLLKIKVNPKDKKQEIADILSDGTIKIKLRSAPEDNKANQELIEFLSAYFEIPEKNIQIVNGHTSKRKIIQIQTNALP